VINARKENQSGKTSEPEAIMDTSSKSSEAKLPGEAAGALESVLEEFTRKQHSPGLMAGLVSDGGLRWVKPIGLADREHNHPVAPDTRFRIASMTKNVTALTILMLRDDGKVALEAPVREYVPEFAKLALPTADSRPVSLRDLLNHSAGFVTDDPWGDRQLGISPQDFTRMIAAGGLFAQAPGLAYEYSNLGYGVLGRVITNVSGRKYQDVIGERLLKPLGMQATTFDFFSIPEAKRAIGYRWAHDKWSPEAAEPDGEIGAMGGLVTTAEDYARYMAFLLSAWPARDDAETGPVRRATVRELGLAHGFPQPATQREVGGKQIAVSSAYGYGTVQSNDPVLGRTLHHRGGLPGYGSHVLISPDTGIGLFAFANVTYADADRATFAMADALHAAGVWKPRERRVSKALADAVAAAVRAYNAGKLEASDLLSGNLLLDESAEDRSATLAKLKAKFGEGQLDRIEPQHDLAGKFVVQGAKGLVSGSLILTPGPRPRIQTLEFKDASDPKA
jgi:CubicO group peptidase (beta-lactamase class C family)